MKTFFNRDTAPITGTGRKPTHDRGLNIALHRESVRHNLRKERRMKQALGTALALALFRTTEGRRETEEERREIIPNRYASEKRVRKASITVSIDMSWME